MLKNHKIFVLTLMTGTALAAGAQAFAAAPDHLDRIRHRKLQQLLIRAFGHHAVPATPRL